MPIARAGFIDQESSIRSLGLEGKQELRVQSYVNLRHHCAVPLSRLRQYGGGPNARAYHFRLARSSYRALMAALSLPGSPYRSTETLHRETESNSVTTKALIKSEQIPFATYEPSDMFQLPPPTYFEDALSQENSSEFLHDETTVHYDAPELQPLLGGSSSQDSIPQPTYQRATETVSDQSFRIIPPRQASLNSTLPRWQAGKSQPFHQDSLFSRLILRPLRKIRWDFVAWLVVLAAILGTGYGIFVFCHFLVRLIIAECKAIATLVAYQWRSLLVWIKHIPTGLSQLVSKVFWKTLGSFRHQVLHLFSYLKHLPGKFFDILVRISHELLVYIQKIMGRLIHKP